MFGKKKCPRCNKSIGKKHNFCYNCGLSMREGEKFFEPAFNLGFPFNMMLGQLTKQLEKQIEKEFKDMDKGMIDMDNPQPIMQGMTINVDMSNGNPVIKVGPGNQPGNAPGNQSDKKTEEKGNKFKSMISEERATQMSKLPKEDPSTTIRRLADRLVYEISLPEVNKDNIMITRLQNSIEIRAYSKDKAFFKLIPISLPILDSKLEDGKLILELKPQH